MIVFSNTPGVVAAVVTGQALPFAVAVGGTGGVPALPGSPLLKAILVGFDLAGASGLGVRHTLRDRIYLWTFGERAQDAVVHGLAFPGVCGATAPGGYTGLDAVYAYYERVRASTQGAPARLVFGPATTLAGFMSDFQFRLEDAQTGLGSFAFKFKAMPRNVLGTPPPLPWE